jgi:ParB family chromosome partitioning protein
MLAPGHSPAEIARATGVALDYVLGVSRLLDAGGAQLLAGLGSRPVPVQVSIDVRLADDGALRAALAELSEKGEAARDELPRRVEGLANDPRDSGTTKLAGGARPQDAFVKLYEEDAEGACALIQRSETAKARLTLLVEALKILIADDAFVLMLDEQGLDREDPSSAGG